MNGRVAEALDVYWRCGAAVDPQRLGRLSRALVGAAAGAAAPRDAALGCPACRGPPLAPVTGPCGHTWCRPCAPAGRCPACRRAAPQPLADNVLVKAAVAKWWPLAAQADRLRHQAILLIAADLAEPAIAHLNAAIRVCEYPYLTSG
ncbi:hypothetical protein AAG570_004450 [Ranatra chinensis]|uniref:RING-type domain-containing protein n=1 Tax=Ranatra chinensis TaxID=642074 RepID=A0ABD0Y0W6_9HEMI